MNTYNYDDISKVYDDVRYGDVELINKMIQDSDIDTDSYILEIGCGTGNYLKIFEQSFNNVYGIDQSQGMLSKAKEKCNHAIFTLGDATILEAYNDCTFDLIYMVDVIHHIKEVDKFFKSINRVLKKGGYLYIFTDSHDHIKNRLTTKYFPQTLEYELGRYQSFNELTCKLKQNNFTDIETNEVMIGYDHKYGFKLIELAKKRGYSMFGFLTDEDIESGVNRIKDELENGVEIVYKMKAPYIKACKA